MLKEQIREILSGLLKKVSDHVQDVVEAVWKIEKALEELEERTGASPAGEIEFEFSVEKRLTDEALEDFDCASVDEVLSFKASLVIALMRHHPTDLKLAVRRDFEVLHLETFELLTFDDCLHMESREDHPEIVRRIRERLQKVDADSAAERMEKAIRERGDL